MADEIAKKRHYKLSNGFFITQKSNSYGFVKMPKASWEDLLLPRAREAESGVKPLVHVHPSVSVCV